MTSILFLFLPSLIMAASYREVRVSRFVLFSQHMMSTRPWWECVPPPSLLPGILSTRFFMSVNFFVVVSYVHAMLAHIIKVFLRFSQRLDTLLATLIVRHHFLQDLLECKDIFLIACIFISTVLPYGSLHIVGALVVVRQVALFEL